VKLSEIVEATGMSKDHASVVRRGLQTPHVSMWVTLAELAEFSDDR
jgi:DNA-binding transcriptional regulator GbsR (MarR family)